MPEITPERLREIEARCAAASPGPWNDPKIMGLIFTALESTFSHPSKANNENNAIFIGHARTDIPDLIEALKLARKEG